jgi:hypothetical protein
VEGAGLVFNPGERVHTFTSPLGVLVPALCSWLAGPGHEQLGLWFFRLINATLLSAAGVLVWKRAETAGLRAPGRWLFFGLMFADAKLNDFSTNGMETALLVFFALLLWSELEAPPQPRVRTLAIATAGLMWTRPDAFILAGALIVPHLLFRNRGDGTPGLRLDPLVRGICLGGLLYAPWFVWAWWYYGSPVPHTIIAKSAFTPPVHLRELLLQPLHELTGFTLFDDLFLPSYWIFGGWPRFLNVFSHILALIAAFAWVIPRCSAAGRRLSLTVFLGMFYLCSIILFPWYIPHWTVLAALALAFGFDQVYARVASRRVFATSFRLLGTLAVLVQIGIFAGVAWQMRWHQRFVEHGVRQNIGEWLHENAAPTDSVFLEPLGYIGYFSRLKTYDFPGLSSPEVVAALHHGSRNYADLIEKLQPTWVVLRPVEAARSEFVKKPVLKNYQLVKSWDAIPQLDTIRFLPGRPWVQFEAQYQLYRRLGAGEAPAP